MPFKDELAAELTKRSSWEFPGSPVVKTWGFTAMDPGSVSGQRTEIRKLGRATKKTKKGNKVHP